MKKSRILILILGIFLLFISSISYSQTYDSTKKIVELPLKKYMAIRSKLYKQDTLISNLYKELSYKDTIIKNNNLKSSSYIREIEIKNSTIDTLSKEYYKIHIEYTKEKKSFFNNYKPWIGIAIGLAVGALITK